MAVVDSQWKARRWQTTQESKSDYIKRLVTNIADCKKMIAAWDAAVAKYPQLAEEVNVTIQVEREMLADYQAELQKVVAG